MCSSNHSISPQNIVYAFLVWFCGVSIAPGNSLLWFLQIFYPYFCANFTLIFAHIIIELAPCNYYAIFHSYNGYAALFCLHLLCVSQRLPILFMRSNKWTKDEVSSLQICNMRDVVYTKHRQKLLPPFNPSNH